MLRFSVSSNNSFYLENVVHCIELIPFVVFFNISTGVLCANIHSIFNAVLQKDYKVFLLNIDKCSIVKKNEIFIVSVRNIQMMSTLKRCKKQNDDCRETGIELILRGRIKI